MTKTELQTMYEVMFTDYPDIVNVAQVQSMLKISRHLAYELIGDGCTEGEARTPDTWFWMLFHVRSW